MSTEPLSDMATFMNLLASAGVPSRNVSDEWNLSFPDQRIIEVKNWAAGSWREPGYNGFSATWHFDSSGKLIGIGHWE